jgi:single-strand DNA-binding protein
MAGYQHLTIVGNVGRDPETRDVSSGNPVSNFSVAVTRRWNDRATGDKREETTWFRVAAFGPLSNVVQQYVRKGGQVMVAGRINARAYLDNNGQPACSLDLTADTIQLLGSRDDAPAAASNGAVAPEPEVENNIPF